MSSSLRVIILKPGKYDVDGYVQRFRSGFMPNSTLSYLASLTPKEFEGARCDVITIDELNLPVISSRLSEVAKVVEAAANSGN